MAGSDTVTITCPTDCAAQRCSEPGREAHRPLIYVTGAPDRALVSYLRDAGWNVIICCTAADVIARAEALDAAAGFIDFDGFTPKKSMALQTCLSRPRVSWVAAGSAQRMGDATVRRLIRHCCFDYVTLPLAPERIAQILGHALGMAALDEADTAGDRPVAAEGAMVGSCDAMQRVFRTVRKVAASHASVFIAGESGTGKEFTALAIHQRSSRRKAPFVAINCGAIPPLLLQSELFGYERGAFTGANQRKIGRIEAAHGGTLFLDEIGDMPIEAQASLLRFLQERKIERLGGHEPIPVDVRVISATHVDLEAAIREGRFRTDLFHRLCVLRIDEPPLRVRGQDIEKLAHHFLNQFRNDNVRKIRGFTPCAIRAMHSHAWPGNVRELLNRIRRAIVMAESRLVSAQDLDLVDTIMPQMTTLAQAREAADKRAIEAAMLLRRQRFGEAASDLGISRVTLYRLMTAYGLRQPASGSAADDVGDACLIVIGRDTCT